jgi:outer membrane immunogenic protein
MRIGVVVGSQQLLRNLDIVAQQFRHRGISMKRLAIAVSVLGISAASAFAADLPAHTYTKAPMMAAYDWSGFYVGANGGYGSSSNCWNLDNIAGVPLAPGIIPEGCHDATGGVAGGQVGYRWQTGALVAGLEAQGNWADLRGSNFSSAFGPIVTNQSKIDAFGLFAGQFGYAWNNTLLYVKSGLAVTSDKYQGLTTGVAFDAASETRVGYSAGVGLEYGFTPNWSLALEYDHFFMFESDNAFTAVAGGALTRIDSIHQDVDLVTARLNYRFGGPVVARY